MYLEGKVYRDGKFWIAECEALDAMTQGKSKKDAIEMLKDWICSALENPKFPVDVKERLKKGELVIFSENNPALIALVLQRTREKSGLSLREAAKSLGFKSHNAYAQYEQGRSEPSLSQLERFLSTMSPHRGVRVKIG
jgi:DNA-binding XRE family transcriptional regulator